MKIEPTPEHEWLKRMVGKWEYEAECSMGPDQEPFRGTGTESVRMLGDLWVLCELEGTMPDSTPMTSLLTIGYDPARGKFVGTYVGSVMTNMFVYEGELDADCRTLTQDTTGPDCSDPSRQMNYQDIFEWQDDGSRVLRSQYQDGEGSWHQMMQAVFRRVG
jgi:hypothetical protein